MLSFLFLAGAAKADKHLFGVVSDRSAAELAAGAARLAEQQPELTIALRTPTQLLGMSDSEIVAQIKRADALVAAATFGDQVARLEKLITENAAHKPFLGVNSDLRLVRLSRDQNGLVFAGITSARIREMSKAPKEDEGFLQWHERRRMENPRQAVWIDAKSWWQARGQNNLASFLAHAAALAGMDVKPGKLVARADVRVWYKGRLVRDAGAHLPKRRPWNALMCRC